MQPSPLVRVEGRQEVVFETARELAEPLQLAPSVCGQLDDVPTAIRRVTAAGDEPARLQLIEQPDQLAAVVAEGIGDRACVSRGLSASARRIAWW